MSMVIANNMAALNALNTLGRNTKDLSKALKQAASGEKINSAGDDASGYSISEKMKSQLRALGQCDQNTKTAHSMLNIASEAVNQQVEIMRKVYTIALKASDDTYTDFDRGILQKELNQLHTEIEDIAQETTYNGRYLLNIGTIEKPTFDSRGPFNKNQPAVLQKSSTGLPPGGGHPYGRSDIPGWKAVYAEYGTSSTPPSAGQAASAVTSIPGSHAAGYAYRASNKSEMEMDFGLLSSRKLPQDIDGTGVSVTCSDCTQFMAIQFDAKKSSSVFIKDEKSNDGSGCFVIGLKNVSSAADLEKAIFNGVCQAKGVAPTTVTGGKTVQLAPYHNTTLKYNDATGHLTVTKDSNGLVFCDGVVGTVTKPGDPMQSLYVQGDVKQSQATAVFSPRTTLDALYRDGGWNPTKENPEPNPNLSDCVSTREKASDFLSSASDAIDVLLNGNTLLGAELSRMEYMSKNLVTEHENVTNAESVIRDADMAMAMTDFTKANVLAQAAQSMLAQANQNSSNVLSLLQ